MNYVPVTVKDTDQEVWWNQSGKGSDTEPELSVNVHTVSDLKTSHLGW